MAKLFLRPDAQRDIQNIVSYYDEINLQLSDSFLADLDLIISNIKDHPEGYQRRIGEVRIAFLHKFSFGIFYKIYPSHISIIAVLHTSQDFERWLSGR